MYLKRTPLQMFPKVAGKIKKIGGVYENSNIFCKVFYADVETFKWLVCSFTLMKSCHRFFMPMARLSNGCSILLL